MTSCKNDFLCTLGGVFFLLKMLQYNLFICSQAFIQPLKSQSCTTQPLDNLWICVGNENYLKYKVVYILNFSLQAKPTFNNIVWTLSVNSSPEP